MATKEASLTHSQKIRLTVTNTGYNKSTNKSQWSWKFEYYQGSSVFSNGGSQFRLVGFYDKGWAVFTVNHDGWKTVASGTFERAHKSDGTLASENLKLEVKSTNSYIGGGSVTVFCKIGAGDGGSSSANTGARVRVSNVWKRTTVYIRHDKKWRKAIVFVRVRGKWLRAVKPPATKK